MQNTQTQQKRMDFSAVFSKHGALIAFIILFVFNSIFTNNFFRMQTVWNLLTQSCTTVLLSLGMTVVIATAGIDISVGSAMALASMVAAKFIMNGEIFIGVALGLLSVLFFGYITGTIVIKFDIQSMIVSLSMMFILRGIAKLLNDGRILSYRNKAFTNFFYLELFDVIPIRLVIWLSMAIFLWLLMSKTRYGVYIEAYGDNPHTTRISGIGVVSVITSAYMICALFAGVAGIIEAGYSTTVDPANIGLTKEMDAIAATVVGGTSISGGKPRIWGTVFGALVLQLITIMVNMNNIPVPWARIIKAAIIIVAIYLQKTKKH